MIAATLLEWVGAVFLVVATSAVVAFSVTIVSIKLLVTAAAEESEKLKNRLEQLERKK